jgi:transcriptional regulator with XRE-family HTH domain
VVTTAKERMARRCRCTGETPNTLRRQHEPLQPGLLVPSATNQDQRELEAAILMAVNRMSDAGWSFINWVGPGMDSLRLEVARDAVMTFLAESMPVLLDGEICGIPGLRPRPGRHHVDFRVLGLEGETKAVVRLLGVGKEQWREITASMRRAEVQLWRECRGELHPYEAELVRNRAAVPVDQMSGVLRRFALLRGATSIDSAVEGDVLSVRWRGGPDSKALAAILGESECRIPGTLVQSLGLSRLSLSPHQEGATYDEPDWAWVSLEITPTAQAVPVIEEGPWDAPDMRAALAARDMSQVYRLLRKSGVSQRQIAARTGQSQSEVSEILKGRQVMAYDVLARIANGLGVPRGYLGLDYDVEPRVQVIHDPVPESEKRRSFLAHAAAVAMGANLSADNEPCHPNWVEDPGRRKAAARALRSLMRDFYGEDDGIRMALAKLEAAVDSGAEGR